MHTAAARTETETEASEWVEREEPVAEKEEQLRCEVGGVSEGVNCASGTGVNSVVDSQSEEPAASMTEHNRGSLDLSQILLAMLQDQ